MSRIPFIHSKFPDPKMSRAAIEKRLTAHWHRLQKNKAESPQGQVEEESVLTPSIYASEAGGLPWNVKSRISRRASLIIDRYEKSMPLGQLKSDDRKRLEVFRDGVDLANIGSEHRADEIAAELHAEYPWLGRATEHAWHSMLHSVRSGNPALWVRPLLIDGPPGIGKSAWARSLAASIGVPSLRVDATTESANFGLVGSQKGWGNSAPGKLMNLMLTHRVGNPLVIIDEIEKAGNPMSNGGHTHSLADALLPLLEPLSASQWACPYFQIEFDMRWVNWVLTSNDSSQLPEPLLSRCPQIRLEHMTCKDLTEFVRRQVSRRSLSETSAEAICEVVEWAFRKGQKPDLRTVGRMLERADRLENRPAMN